MSTSGIVVGMIAIIFLILFSAFFSGSETALMSISRIRLKHLVKTKPRRTKIVENILQKPEKLIGTILLGNNLVNVAMSALATAIAIALWGDKGIAYVTGILTLLILIFAEITPKVYAKYYNERVSLVAAPILRVIMVLMNPVVITVTYLANRLLRIIGIDVSKVKRPIFTEEELKTCIQISRDDGSITKIEKDMLSRIFTLNDKTVKEVMVPKDKMITLDLNWSNDKVLNTVHKSGYSRFPVTKGNDLEVMGYIHSKDLLKFMGSKKSFTLNKILRVPLFVEEDRKIDTQLRSFKAKKVHLAMVLDNDGELTGLLTLEDILEEFVGNIEDEHDK